MSTDRRLVALLVAALAWGSFAGLTLSATAAQAKTCQAPAGRYDVTPPPAGFGKGADPAEVAAANCSLGFVEKQAYPLSVIGLCLLASLGTVLLLRRADSYEPIGGGS